MENDKSCLEERLGDFQSEVSRSLLRHKSVLDIVTKMEEYNARVIRAVTKAATMCGCIEIHATKQAFEADSLEDLAKSLSTHVTGELCPACREALEVEMGSYLFYMVALCNTFDIKMSEVLNAEYVNTKMLGLFSMK